VAVGVVDGVLVAAVLVAVFALAQGFGNGHWS
jgi:hypothetical protein